MLGAGPLSGTAIGSSGQITGRIGLFGLQDAAYST
jgi:hypothetical protein